VSTRLPVSWAAAALAVVSLPQATLAVGQADAPVAKQPERAAARPDVIISGQRELEPRIAAFVDGLVGSYLHGEGLARWQKPVCPLVAGLPREEGEFILGRVSDIARAARIGLAGEKCRPNVYILVTGQPQDLLRGMGKRNRWFTFGGATTNVIEKFITTPEPVRVWYHTSATTPEGTPLLSMSYPAFRSTVPGAAGGGNSSGITSGDPGVSLTLKNEGPDVFPNTPPYIASGTNTWAQASRLSFNAIWEIYRVFVVVDLAHLRGVTRGQIADYVGIVALAQLDTGIGLGDSPTILKLFDGAPEAAPAGLSDWDEAFLRALYSTEQRSHLQRSQIVRAMVREMAH
jgi:hypothetical protein